jgi:DNA polymerase III subunit epsilon
MYLFFDTETNGLPANWKKPVTDVHNWPRMVQLAWCQVDQHCQFLQARDFIIKPEGFMISDESVQIHGITTEKAIREGYDLKTVLVEFASVIDRSEIIVAHNLDFDEKIVGAEFVRMQIPHPLFSKRRICTMKQSTDFCRIPGNYGFKWPTLTELHTILFQTEFNECHNALVDVQACVRCFCELKKKGIVRT